jgi:tRNA threonylcarbamoyladenosine biosynthesis protein TsaB
VLTLGIETSTRQVSCAVGDGSGVLGTADLSLDQRHTETLVPAIRFLLDSLGLTVEDLGAVAVGLGPGLFTGLRVGVATARSLSLARHLPLLGVSSLDLVAHRVRVAGRPIIVAMDARRGELFWCRYEPCGARPPRRVQDDRVDPPAAVASAVAGLDSPLVAGDGPARYPDVFVGLPGVETVAGELARPTAAALVELAAPRLVAGEATPPALVLPRYVRAPDADAHWVERPARGSPSPRSVAVQRSASPQSPRLPAPPAPPGSGPGKQAAAQKEAAS